MVWWYDLLMGSDDPEQVDRWGQLYAEFLPMLAMATQRESDDEYSYDFYSGLTF